jgi:hypothetical protein
VLWAIIWFTPALLFFVKVYEERELETRSGVQSQDTDVVSKKAKKLNEMPTNKRTQPTASHVVLARCGSRTPLNG